MLFLPGRINWKPASAVWAWNAVGEPGALFCHVECLDVWGTVTGGCLYGMSLVVVVFLVVELILYIELTVETWSSCRNAELCVETLETLLDLSWNED